MCLILSARPDLNIWISSVCLLIMLNLKTSGMLVPNSISTLVHLCYFVLFFNESQEAQPIPYKNVVYFDFQHEVERAFEPDIQKQLAGTCLQINPEDFS